MSNALEDVVDIMADEAMGGRTFTAPDQDYYSDDPTAWMRAATERAIRRHLDRLPGALRGASIARLHPWQHPDTLGWWVRTRVSRTLALGGDPGTGKTYGAAAVANAFACAWMRDYGLRRTPVEWWTVVGLLDALRPSADDGERVWQRVTGAPLLVLDDLGHGRPTEWAAERMWMLLNVRAEAAEAWTAVTTNASGEQLAGAWGAGTIDRLRADATMLTFTGRSLRQPHTAGGAR